MATNELSATSAGSFIPAADQETATAVATARDRGRTGIHKNLVLAVMSLSTFMVFLDGTVVNTALPSISREFGASNSILQWVINAYSLLVAGLLLVGGTTGDRFGRRKVFAAGMTVFGLGSVGAAFATGSDTLIAMRGVQGIGAAFLLPSTLSIITDVFGRGERARAIAIWTAAGSLGMVAGPMLGGLVVDEIGWKAVFLLHIPVVVAALVGLKVVPESKDSRLQSLDIPGAFLVTAGLLATVYGIIQGGETGWASAEIIGSFVIGGSLLVVFVIVELRISHPMLPLRYFKQADFTGSFLVMLVLWLAMMGVFYFLTQYFQLVQEKTAFQAGLAIMPSAGAMMLGAGFASKTENVLGPKVLSVVAIVSIISGLFLFMQLEIDTAYAVPAIALSLFGLGAGIIMTALTDTIMASVPVNDAGIGSAMNDTSRELGFALGIAILGSVVNGVYRSNVTDSVKGLVPEQAVHSIGDSLGAAAYIAQDMPSYAGAILVDLARQNFVDALSVGFVGSAVFIAAALVAAIAIVPNRMRTHQADEQPASPAIEGVTSAS